MLHHNLKNINQLSTSLGKGSKDMTSSAVFKEGGQESSHRNAKIHPETITPVEISAEPQSDMETDRELIKKKQKQKLEPERERQMANRESKSASKKKKVKEKKQVNDLELQ